MKWTGNITKATRAGPFWYENPWQHTGRVTRTIPGILVVPALIYGQLATVSKWRCCAFTGTNWDPQIRGQRSAGARSSARFKPRYAARQPIPPLPVRQNCPPNGGPTLPADAKLPMPAQLYKTLWQSLRRSQRQNRGRLRPAKGITRVVFSKSWSRWTKSQTQVAGADFVPPNHS